MTGKILGKITSAEYGIIHDYTCFMGLQLHFKLADGCAIGDGGKYTVNMSEACKWDDNKRRESIEKRADQLYNLLKDAHVSNVSELKNIPVEVTVEGNCFKDFRILTEVL